MAKQQEASFFPFDFTKFMADWDPQKMQQEMTKAFAAFSVPQVDMNAVVDTQRKNIEAVTAANQVAIDGMQAVTRRQAEIFQEIMGEASSAVNEISKVEAGPDAAAKQVEVMKTAFEHTLTNMQELAELVAKSNAEAAQTINKRIGESLDEIKTMTLAMKQK